MIPPPYLAMRFKWDNIWEMSRYNWRPIQLVKNKDWSQRRGCACVLVCVLVSVWGVGYFLPADMEVPWEISWQSAGGPGFMTLAQGSEANQSDSEVDRRNPRSGWRCDDVVCTHRVCLLSNLQRKKQPHTIVWIYTLWDKGAGLE